MSIIRGINGRAIDLTVVSAHDLRNTQLLSRQDPYVCFEYFNKKYRTKTCKDGGTNPYFQETFNLTLVEGVREIQVTLWNQNFLSGDDLIAFGRIHLDKVLHEGSDDSMWPLQYDSTRHAGHVKRGGELRVIMKYYGDQAVMTNYATMSLAPPSAPVLAPPPPYQRYSTFGCTSYNPPYPPPPPRYPPPPPQYPPHTPLHPLAYQGYPPGAYPPYHPY